MLLAVALALLVAGCETEEGPIDSDGDGVPDSSDCAPDDPDVYPLAPDPHGDGIDQDCDGADGIDRDGDGFAANAEEDADCDDSSAETYPGAPDEAGDGIDQDCDAADGRDADGDGFASLETGGTDCDDTDPEMTPGDGDGDGSSPCSGDCDDGDPDLNAADLDGDGFTSCLGDCDDDDPDAWPGTAELCDGIDQDCDGSMAGEQDADLDGDLACADCDDDDPTLQTLDLDGDGVSSCDGDCLDTLPSVNPLTTDVAGDGVDANCDGVDGTDMDGDGEASTASGGTDCDDGDAAVLSTTDLDGDGAPLCGGDCDDGDGTRYPGATELCDGIDQDCDGLGEIDTDGDGSLACADCDDGDASRFPSAVESCDGIDQDCDGLVDEDFDGDGDGSTTCAGDCDDADPDLEVLDLDGDGFTTCAGDCDDLVALVNPLSTDVAGDGVDRNCDGVDGIDFDGDGEAGTSSGGADCDDTDPLVISTTDGDGDGAPLCSGDCDDGDATRRPGLPEACNGVDDDCDGLVLGEADGDGDGTLACADCDDADPGRSPLAVEVCDGVDQDCDGLVDEDFDGDGDGWTTCAGDCDDADASVRPGFPEACDGVDTNCDGYVVLEGDWDGDGWLACEDCADGDASVHPGAEEVCDGVDQDCDTIMDNPPDDDGDGYSECEGDCDDGDPEPCRVVQVMAGGSHTCALLHTGAVRCWGANPFGGLGYGNFNRIGDDEVPAVAGDVPLGGVGVDVEVGSGYTCALLDDGGVRCWGGGLGDPLGYGAGELIGDDEFPSDAGDVPLGGPAIQVSAGTTHTCVVLSSHAVRCWGMAGSGQLGYGDTNDCWLASTAGDVPLGGVAVQVAVGGTHTCAVLDTGAIRCWGLGSYGRLGYGNTETIGDDEYPSDAGDVPLGATAVQVSAGWAHTCVLLGSGAVRCWGDGSSGQLGYGNTEDIGDDELPAAAGDVPLGGMAVQISAGGDHTCALLDTGAVRCWGYGAYGQLGYGNTESIAARFLTRS